tara:strand:- start:428 stop:724 length:297 start_codon:yes stop_codon:yes gene_type:complete
MVESTSVHYYGDYYKDMSGNEASINKELFGSDSESSDFDENDADANHSDANDADADANHSDENKVTESCAQSNNTIIIDGIEYSVDSQGDIEMIEANS